MTEITRHFTATTFIVHHRKTLLHCHSKQRLWLPPGGHIDRDELPHHAAAREMEEETGLRLPLHSQQEAARLSREMECGVVPQPAFILVEDINPFHQHVDFTYFARPADCISADLPAIAVENGFSWLSLDDLQAMDGVPTNVHVGARRAVEYFARE